jgi:hypothetical protein
MLTETRLTSRVGDKASSSVVRSQVVSAVGITAL